MTEDQVIETFDMRTVHALIPKGAPVIIVYDNPRDYPGFIVARLFNGIHPTHLIALAKTPEEIQEAKPAEMIRIPKQDTDPPKVIETWL